MIHREGHTLLIVLLVVLGGLTWATFQFVGIAWVNYLVLAASVIFYLLILQFFRNPSRNTPLNPSHIIAPADGKVVVIEDTMENEYFKGERKQISIFMSPVNVHVNRNPISGAIQYFKYHAGKYLVAWHPKSSTENERTTIVIRTDNGVDVLFRQIAGALAKRIKWYISEGDAVKQGEEFGFIKFGSRIDIYLPLDANVKVNIGDKTRGGETVVAELV